MKKSLIVVSSSLLFLSLVFLFTNKTLSPAPQEYISQEEYVPNELLVRFKKDVSKYLIQVNIDSIQGKVITFRGEEIEPIQWDPDTSSLRSFRLDPDLLHVKIPEIIGTEQAIYLLGLNPNIEYVQKNLIYHFDTEPNDPDFNKLWGLKNTGQAGGTSDADIDATDAWDSCTGTGAVKVAILDSGVDYTHEDLWQNIWENSQEVDGVPGEDDDGNDLIDDYYGWDFWDQDNDPMDLLGHGTHVAGIIGAKGNNNKGVTGVNWNVEIMILRVGDMGASTSAIINALEYVREKGVKLSNNSYGGFQYDSALLNAINAAGQDGHLYVCSAGNSNLNVDIQSNKTYPCCYSLDNIICVASTNNDDEKSDFSNWGSTSVDLAAPGGEYNEEDPNSDDIYSTLLDDEYGWARGTSMSVPYVTGAAALAWANNPTLTYQQVKSKIMSSVDELSSLSGKCVSEGRLNVHQTITPYAPSNLNGYPTAWTYIRIWWQDNSNDENGFKIYRKYGSNDFEQVGTVGTNVTSYEDKTCTAGTTYTYKVSAYCSGCQNPAVSPPSNTNNETIPTSSPAAPAYLEAEEIGWEEVGLWWDDESNNEQVFRIYRKTQYGSWHNIDSVPPNTIDYEDTDPPTGWLYYKVRAYNPSGWADSNVASVYIEPWESQKEKPKSEKNQ